MSGGEKSGITHNNIVITDSNVGDHVIKSMGNGLRENSDKKKLDMPK